MLAKEILANRSGRYREHSDFFCTSKGIFGPRVAQVEIGQAARALLQEHLNNHAVQVPGLIKRDLTPSSLWPDAASRLMYAYFGPVLLGPETPEAVRGLVGQVVRQAVMAGARDRLRGPARVMFRGRVMRALAAEIMARRSRGSNADILDIVARAAPDTADPGQLAEVFLSFLFAVVGSVGFLVAWSVYLLGTSPSGPEVQPLHIAREALRLWPVAWLFGRRPAVSHELGGIAVTPQHDVVVCSYLVQRHPAHWTEPDAFRPERWAGTVRSTAYLPFGWGRHSCVGAAIALQFAELVISILTTAYHLQVTQCQDRAHIAAALAPPQFTARLTPLPL
ncbi:MAG TPA: cytochrome P450 [Streptosporangiaceae bacterium]